MRKIIIFLQLFILSFVANGQIDSITMSVNSDTIINNAFVLDTVYPQPFVIDGEVVGVLFSLEQAQKIDNDYEMYSLMDSIIMQYGLNDSITIGIIDAQNNNITTLTLQVSNLKQMLSDKDNMLDNRDVIISELRRKIQLQESQIKLHVNIEASYKSEIKDLKKEVKKQKRQKILAFITTTITTVGVVVLTLIK